MKRSPFRYPYVCFLFATAFLNAAVITQDNFVVDGKLDGSEGGSGFSGAWSGGRYTVSGGTVSGTGDSYRGLIEEFGASGEVWLSFDFGVNSDRKGYGGISFFDGKTERIIIGDYFGANYWGIDAKIRSDRRVKTAISTLGMKTGVVRMTLAPGAKSRVDLWVGPDAREPVNIRRRPDASISGATLQGVDTVRIGADIKMQVADLVIGDSYRDIPEPRSFSLLFGLVAFAFVGIRRLR